MQILREWRGGLHLVATTAVGLSPLEAILTNEGPGQAKFFGWSEPFPDVSAIKAKHDEAEEITDRLCAAALAEALDAAKYPAFETGVAALRAATPVGPAGQPRGGRRAGTGYSEGLLNGRKCPTGEHDGSLPPRTCGAARSARRPVKAEVAGSNPVRSAARFQPTRTVEPGYPVG